ncbi:hypothetical protein S2M10_43010 [Sphingomonas sp. S2M10]|jgi:hypothetical protein|uniref:hypothetical protein n=1 Tax=Sphingomonas sp. S2M10 TaxID=2705010 RepID=UPI001456951F|nr:hypothetical protein [Sphingomonas sp. S2M10]NLS29279.1 hypothetical protein [Sphingomonas sp. S2M10]
MDMRSFLYALWSLAVVGLFLVATIFGWSPFAEGGRAAGARGYGSGGHAGFYGPHHK